jgi:DeoR/GlpR family transcriptional regulator of sugar metabolism
VAELTELFDVDPSTIRRDLNILEERNALQRVHGGAIALDDAKGATVGVRGALSWVEQTRLGRTVVDMIPNGETIFLGPGGLCLEVARCLDRRERLTVVTNSLDVAHWVAEYTDHTLIVTGGQVEGPHRGMIGELTRAAFSSLRADRLILELGGISAVGGLTDDSLPQAEITSKLFDLGLQIVILVRGERVGRVAAAYIAPVSEADVIVTARDAPSSFLWDLSETGVRIVLA